MNTLTERLLLPLSNYIGGRGLGTIKTIAPGIFQAVDDRFPAAVSEMLVSVDNAGVFLDNEAVTL